MDGHLRHLFISILCFTLYACGGGSNSSQNAPVNTGQNQAQPTSIQEILDSSTRNGVDGIFVYVEQTNGVNEAFSSGIQNRETQLPADANALFKVASISKLFIAVSAAKIVVQGDISLDDTLASWLPEFADHIENAERITIRQLIQHRSGIADFDSQEGFSWQNAHTDIDQTLNFALGKPADFEPDSRYEYSNTNYLLLAKVLDSALGYSHEQYILEHILQPLELQNTFYKLSDIAPDRLVKGYWLNIERSTQDYAIPGGSMISTVKDIATFIRALNTGNLLTSEERQVYFSVYWKGHAGWLPGYQSIADIHPDIDTVVVQFVNTTGGNSESLAQSTYNNVVNFLSR